MNIMRVLVLFSFIMTSAVVHSQEQGPCKGDDVLVICEKTIKTTDSLSFCMESLTLRDVNNNSKIQNFLESMKNDLRLIIKSNEKHEDCAEYIGINALSNQTLTEAVSLGYYHKVYNQASNKDEKDFWASKIIGSMEQTIILLHKLHDMVDDND